MLLLNQNGLIIFIIISKQGNVKSVVTITREKRIIVDLQARLCDVGMVPKRMFFTKGIPSKYKMSVQIVRTQSVAQTTEGNNNNFWATVITAAIFCEN